MMDRASAARGLHLHAAQAQAKGYVAEAIEALDEALEIAIEVVDDDPRHLHLISESLQLSAQVVFERQVEPPRNMLRASSAYHRAALALIAPEHRRGHAVTLIDMSLKMALQGQHAESRIALQVARSIVETDSLSSALSMSTKTELAAAEFALAAQFGDEREFVSTYTRMRNAMGELAQAGEEIPVTVKLVFSRVNIDRFKGDSS